MAERNIADPQRQLAEALTAALPLLKADRRGWLECHCLLTPGTFEPRRETLDDVAKPAVEELERVIELATKALEAANG